ncbi:hypothetical protein C7B65_25265 [Phormidesmis priestleyi ULC007]|uniref:Uncharacterized protein n=1 Tax=Phormidesmis priestleyi ULC007 TaxID=1920490 RepID=A0A2T1D3T0_9CYAN|nr:hypothetical protein [Phormidesmis priestleyi]PSB15111.1 hypothetical protein C7B65_25265 [Phormidesmis priestleyi ULC007]PZO45997.1 MAG: hypothetical protein DCF14_24115 [Phormidesmis priestleyi]
MMTNPPDRLDRIEAILANLASRDETYQQRFEELDRRQDITQRQIDVLLALHDETTERLDRQDRQLEVDRAEFRSTVRDILSHLQTRYDGNGGS